jgi:hypothetical protein
MYQRFQEMTTLMDELLTHRPDPSLARLSRGLASALSTFASDYQGLAQGAGWLRDIASLLVPPTHQPVTGEQVAQHLRIYLDDLGHLPNLSPNLNAFRQHLDKVSTSYWPGLFHCYDLQHLPRTDNDLESHFRDTQRQLLRTTGQKGHTRRVLERTGAWKLFPRPPTEAQRLIALQSAPGRLTRTTMLSTTSSAIPLTHPFHATHRCSDEQAPSALVDLTLDIYRVTFALLL